MTTNSSALLRNDKIDLVRGWLIFLVIVGHIVLGSVHDNAVRYSIYAFHMPLFIGLSGYLINTERLLQSNLASLLGRYWRRVLLPFVLAFCAFTGVLIFHAWEDGRLSQDLLASYLLSPYYHLWFIPTLVLWVIALWVILKIKLPVSVCVLLTLLVALLWACLAARELVPYMATLMSKKVVYFFGFFLFGVWLKTKPGYKWLRKVSSVKTLPMVLVIFCAVIYAINVGPEKSITKGLAWLIMNLNLMIVSIAWATGGAKRGSKRLRHKQTRVSVYLVSMGRISLPIYLWHVLPLFVLKGFDVHITMPWVYYALSVFLIAAIVGSLIKLENRAPIANRLLYGV